MCFRARSVLRTQFGPPPHAPSHCPLQIAGLGLIVLALALVAILQEALGVQGDDDATTANTSVSGTTVGILCALGAGVAYATTNVTMQRYLRSSPIGESGRLRLGAETHGPPSLLLVLTILRSSSGPLTLTAAYSAIAFARAKVARASRSHRGTYTEG